MTKNKLFAWAITLLCFSLTSCSDEKDGPSKKILVTNAGVTEANQTVKPGDIVHIYGDGFQEGDQVDFDFRWDLGEPLFPEGYLGPVGAEIVERHSNGMSIRMPYRKPESRVEIFLNRASERMSLGKVLLADGQTPKDFRLYGINETDKTIERAYAEETVTGKKTWDMSAHPDFRSVVNLQKTYGLCGLAEENGVQQPFFLDFCTGEWKALSFYDYNTLALVIGSGNDIAAIQQRGKGYSLYNVSAGLEQSNYATKTRSNFPMPEPQFELPEGFTPEQFGDYSGVFMQGNEIILLSARKGNGKWVPMLYNYRNGFYVLEGIEADAIIPFYFGMALPDSGSPSLLYQKKVGYMIYYSSGDNRGSSFRLLEPDKESSKLQLQEPFAQLSDKKVVSITNRLDRIGTITVLFSDKEEGRTTSDFDWNSKEWTDYTDLSDMPYNSVVWAN